MTTTLALFLCVVFFSAVQGLSEDDKMAYHNECIGQTGADEEVVTKAMGGEFADDPKFKSYLLCFGKKVGFFNEAGALQKDAMRTKLIEMFSDEAAVDKMMECAVDKGTPEDTAFEGCKCMFAVKHQFVD